MVHSVLAMVRVIGRIEYVYLCLIHIASNWTLSRANSQLYSTVRSDKLQGYRSVTHAQLLGQQSYYLQSSVLGDKASFGPELNFVVFDGDILHDDIV